MWKKSAYLKLMISPLGMAIPRAIRQCCWLFPTPVQFANATGYFQPEKANAHYTLLFFCYTCLQPEPGKAPLAQLASQTGKSHACSNRQ